jgi:hypothetical protein
MKSEPMVNRSNQLHRTLVQHPQRLVLLATLAIVGQAILLASAWFLPFASEYSLIADNISELVLGRYGFAQTLAFVLAGLGTVALASAMWPVTPKSWGTRAAVLLVALYGVGAILTAAFPTDRIDSAADVWTQSTTGMIHVSISLVSFPAIIVAMFVLSWTLRRDQRWGSFSVGSAVLFSAALPLFFAQGEGPWVGLMQRLLVTVISFWLIVVAFRVRSIAMPE